MKAASTHRIKRRLILSDDDSKVTPHQCRETDIPGFPHSARHKHAEAFYFSASPKQHRAELVEDRSSEETTAFKGKAHLSFLYSSVSPQGEVRAHFSPLDSERSPSHGGHFPSPLQTHSPSGLPGKNCLYH